MLDTNPNLTVKEIAAAQQYGMSRARFEAMKKVRNLPEYEEAERQLREGGMGESRS